MSVVIPCYRYGHFLEDVVHSALCDQHGVDVRVLIIDDASPDDSAEVARTIANGAAGSSSRVVAPRTTLGLPRPPEPMLVHGAVLPHLGEPRLLRSVACSWW